MSFRPKHNTDSEREWREWLKQHDDLVTDSGLPDIVLTDQDHWYDFLQHGILDHHYDPTCFHVDDLSVRQKAALLRLLMTCPSTVDTLVRQDLIIAMIAAVERRYKRNE